MNQILWNRSDVIGPWVCRRLSIPYYGQHAIGLVDGESGEVLAGVVYEGFNHASIHIHVASEEGRRWCTREFLWYVFHYPFVQLGVVKVIGIVPSANKAAFRLDTHLGFVHEATLKDAHLDGDILLLTMRKEQCRWLNFERKSNHGKQQEGRVAASA